MCSVTKEIRMVCSESRQNIIPKRLWSGSRVAPLTGTDSACTAYKNTARPAFIHSDLLLLLRKLESDQFFCLPQSCFLSVPFSRNFDLAEKMNGGDLNLPPGFRFHPTDEELVMHYLCRRCVGQPINAPIIAEIDLYKYNPWELPGMAMYGEKEWYFFSPRDRKYPNGCRPNRAAGSGYWKATGADKPVGSPKPVAIKKALVFYAGKPPKGVKTNWIMHEYRLADVDRSARKKNNSLRLDDWVLCRIYNKKGVIEKHPAEEEERKSVGSKRPRANLSPNQNVNPNVMQSALKTEEVEFESELGEIWHVTHEPPQMTPPLSDNMLHFDTSESVPLNPCINGESSCSEHVVSPEFTCEEEVQSQSQSSNYWEDWENVLGIGIGINNNEFEINGNWNRNVPVFQPDMFTYLQKPF